MPFQSEKQRRYLWANEPEIARDWTDTYGHRAQGYDGGVMREPFYAGEEVEDSTTIDIDDNTRQAKVNTNQKTVISNQLKQGQSLQDIWEAAKQFDNMFFGKMNKKEFNAYVKEREKKDNTTYGTLAQATDEFADIEGHTASKPPTRLDTMSDAYSGNISNQQSGRTPKGISYNLHRLPYDDVTNQYDRIGTGDALDWSEYTDDPEYDEEEGKDYPVDQPKKGFGDYKTLQAYFADNPQFYQGIAQNLGRGIDKTRDRLGNIYQSGKRRGRQGLNLVGGAYQFLKGGFPFSLAFNAMPSFAYKGATSPAGGYSVAQQNQMNAAGGYYSEPARQNRVLQDRRNYMLQRQREGKSYSDVNLGNVTAQLAANQGLSILNPNEMRNIQPTGGQGALQDRDGGGQTQGQRDTQRAQRDDPGMGGHKKGGRVRFLEGGLASLWT